MLRRSLGVDSDSAVVWASLDDPEQFGLLFERHHRVVWTYLARLAGPDLADELTGEVFVTAFAQRDRFDPQRGRVRSWLYGIAGNKLRGRLRSEHRARRAFARAAVPTFSADNTTIVDDAAALADEARQVTAAMTLLTQADRQLIMLRAWEQLSYAEMPEVLNTPVGTVRSRLSRARGRLRELLDDNGELSIKELNQETL